jgi:hypothetical protein
MIINSINQNFYLKFRLKVVKLSNFETNSPNFYAPSLPIRLSLINLSFRMILYFLFKAILLI